MPIVGNVLQLLKAMPMMSSLNLSWSMLLTLSEGNLISTRLQSILEEILENLSYLSTTQVCLCHYPYLFFCKRIIQNNRVKCICAYFVIETKEYKVISFFLDDAKVEFSLCKPFLKIYALTQASKEIIVKHILRDDIHETPRLLLKIYFLRFKLFSSAKN